MSAPTNEPAASAAVDFETHPDRYRHLRLSVDGAVATVAIDIRPDGGLRPGYALKLNSYDLGVDIELADCVQRLRFEHPGVRCVVLRSALDGVFSAGANIFMLGCSSHAFKVNFCKFTNETRLAIEDACDHSGQRWIAALNGIASGGGYELPLACAEIYLVDDRRSAVSLPEIPFLGVLPGTGGLTRLVDKRMVRRDRADVFVTLAEGLKGRRAVEWGLVDDVFPSSRFDEAVAARAEAIAGDAPADTEGVPLERLSPTVSDSAIAYRHVHLALRPAERVATLTFTLPDEPATIPDDPTSLSAAWPELRAWRELDDALLRLRLNHPEIGLVLLETRGDPAAALAADEALLARADHWFVRETLLFRKRVLKRLDMTAKSFFALVDEGSCFAGSLLELALAADRIYVLDEDGVQLGAGPMNGGPLPMGNGLTRLQTRFLAEPERAEALVAAGGLIDAADADDAGLATWSYDDIDWEDEIRLAVEERASLSPDALTGSEQSLRFAGPETLETKIFGRLTAWQNWIFQRPNAVGPRGALTLYGSPERAEFDFHRT